MNLIELKNNTIWAYKLLHITFFIVVFFYLLSFNVNEYINKATNKPRGQFNN